MSNKILVVEDSRAFNNYLQQILNQAGYEVLAAESYAEAQSILTSQPELLCAVLDYCLPDAQDGEIIDLVLSHQQKVIVLTAMLQDDAREKMLAKGVLDYILKDSMASVSYLLPLIKRLTNNQQHKCLVVDDSMTVRRHVVQLLEHQYIQTLQAENGQQAIEVIEQNPDITLVLTDHDMPIKDGITMIRELRQKLDKNQLAILGISGSDDHSMTARFLKAGANDFLYKPFNQEEFFCRVHQILDMKEATTDLFRMANQDSLTGLWNRRFLFGQTCDSDEQRNIAMLDIDFFKKVNDNYGHDGGDAALVMVANILKIYFPDDVITRFGGEEFCIQAYGSYDDFVTRLEQMRQRVEKTPIPYQDDQIQVTISVGVSNIKGNLDQQIKVADDRLYQAKGNGRNQTVSQ
ncbi:Pole remodelling regulatory diguanylate cyclase [Vibrio harveyi]|uniref:diguanylate cyclase n=1 Tax=Vibrio harveyi TaxID=669 RepID=UPI001EFC88D3|nr:diguanylate cyclase [Vibrio harveyi]MCG9233894.1 diguanylate cyclase [Vibrio harveyi]MCG9585166.1 diguanylate cyclase [Vibrio harveyi]CAH1213668.1 Pole remodelling regulatory diguanylate cyclase [Vibrio harveyi]CAH1563344.1 Pole remodelling regulatory diguanylate cyclase [Vibrio harveyi]CAH1591033.1 Pole remodelling regulatory diguanylate cyclase [Vibrio harveyi]